MNIIGYVVLATPGVEGLSETSSPGVRSAYILPP